MSPWVGDTTASIQLRPGPAAPGQCSAEVGQSPCPTPIGTTPSLVPSLAGVPSCPPCPVPHLPQLGQVQGGTSQIGRPAPVPNTFHISCQTGSSVSLGPWVLFGGPGLPGFLIQGILKRGYPPSANAIIPSPSTAPLQRNPLPPHLKHKSAVNPQPPQPTVSPSAQALTGQERKLRWAFVSEFAVWNIKTLSAVGPVW